MTATSRRFHATVTATATATAIASSVAPLLQGSARAGTVHSVFARAANLLLLPDALLALTTPGLAHVPNGVVVAVAREAPPSRAAREELHQAGYAQLASVKYAGTTWGDSGPLLGLQPGDAVVVGGGTIEAPARTLTIDLAEAAVWEARLACICATVTPATLMRGLAALRQALLAQVRITAGFAPLLRLAVPLSDRLDEPQVVTASESLDWAACHDTPLLRRATPAIAALLVAVAQFDQPRALLAVDRLAGLGPGLTPSGDDFIIGVCAALTLAGATHAVGWREQTSDLVPALASRAANRTTVLSAAWLRHAASGEFSLELHRLCACLVRPDRLGIAQATRALLSFGATSGADTALGLLLGGQAALTRLATASHDRERHR